MKKAVFLFLTGAILFSCNKDNNDKPEDPTSPTSNIPEKFRAFAGIFDGNGVGAAVNLRDDVILLFNQDGDKYAWFEDNEIKGVLNLDDNESAFRSSTIESVGAACLTSETTLYIFDLEGENYTFAHFNSENVSGSWDDEEFFDWSTGSSQTWQWGPDNTIALDRVSALWNLSDPGEDCFDAVFEIDMLNMADGNGDRMQPYSIKNFYFTDGPFPTENWTAENNCGGPDGIIPFNKISAACSYVQPNMIQDIVFNADGTKFSFYTVSQGEWSEIYSLY